MEEFLESAPLWLPGMVAMICLIFASGFFSGSETAIFYLSRDELRNFRVGKPRERLVANLLGDPDRLLIAILFWNLMINLSYFAVSVVVAQRLVAYEQHAAAGIYSVFSLFAIILLGEVMPKSVAVVFRQTLSAWVSLPLAVAVRVLDPVIPLLRRTTVVLRRTFWPHIKRESYLKAEDLERAVEASEQSAEVIRQERQVLHNILDLSEITAEEVMRPRGAYVSLPPPVHVEDLRGEIPPSDYLVIQEEGSENVARAVPLTSFSTIPERNLEEAAEDVVHVPWCASLAYTLQSLRDHFCSLASVVNEYGETVGIVTYEDIIDTILMAEPSRAKRLLQREPILEIAPGRYHVEGITTLRYLCKRLDIDYETTSSTAVTLAGLLHDELEHLPEIGDECVWEGYRLRVIDVTKPGQVRVMMSQEEEKAKEETVKLE